MSPVNSTSAIILKTVKYGDSSLIVNAYTREFGLMGLMARGIHKNKGKIAASTLQPMNLVEIVFSDQKKSSLHYLKEVSLEVPFLSISNSISKSAILMFLNEILYKILKEEQPYFELFDYIKANLMALDVQQNHFANFHLFFLAGLTHFLGIAPNFSRNDALFDLAEGTSTSVRPSHYYYIEKDLKDLFYSIFTQPTIHRDELYLNNQQRNEILDTFLLYFELHLPVFHDVKSKAVLHEILNS